MKPIEYWKLNEELTVFQAALLIAGVDPGNYTSHVVANWEHVPHGYGAAKTALLVAIRNERIDAKVEPEIEYDERGNAIDTIRGSIDIDRTFVKVDSLIAYLRLRNFDSSVFGASEPDVPDYLNPRGTHYAPKLAAAVDAWLQVTSDQHAATVGTPKKRLAKWLRENAFLYGLTKSDGTAIDEAIEQISKIANWKPEGGASKTPGSKNLSTPKRPTKKPKEEPF